MAGQQNDYTRYLSSQDRSPGVRRSPSGTPSPRGRGSPRVRLPETPTYSGHYSVTSSGEMRIPETTFDAPPVAPDGTHGAGAPQPSPRVRLTVDQLLAMEGREKLPRLDPDLPPETLWFDDDSCVASAITSVIVNDFTEPHANWSQVPRAIKDRWFESFAQRYHWDPVITPKVRLHWEKKAMKRLGDIVHRWKQAWVKEQEEEGPQARPDWMSDTCWQGLVRWWLDPASVAKSVKNSQSRMSDPHGTGIHKHRSGQTSFKARGRQIAEKDGDTSVDFLKVLEVTKKKNGEFMDGKSRQIYEDMTAKMRELTQQSSDDPESQGSVTLTVEDRNRIYTEVAPRKKGRIYGLGSLNESYDRSSSSQSFHAGSSALRQELEEAKSTIRSQGEEMLQMKAQMERFNTFMNMYASQNPSGSAGPSGTGTGTDLGTGTGTGTGTGLI